MARASRLKTVKGGPQGPEASVVLLIPTVGEMRAQRKMTLADIKALGEDAEEVEAGANAYLGNHVISWNWVNDDNEVFELPSKNPGILAELTQDELNFIAQALSGQLPAEEEDRKK